jgi:hypothetical protein
VSVGKTVSLAEAAAAFARFNGPHGHISPAIKSLPSSGSASGAASASASAMVGSQEQTTDKQPTILGTYDKVNNVDDDDTTGPPPLQPVTPVPLPAAPAAPAQQADGQITSKAPDTADDDHDENDDDGNSDGDADDDDDEFFDASAQNSDAGGALIVEGLPRDATTELTNADEIRGNVAFVERGQGTTFFVKVHGSMHASMPCVYACVCVCVWVCVCVCVCVCIWE